MPTQKVVRPKVTDDPRHIARAETIRTVTPPMGRTLLAFLICFLGRFIFPGFLDVFSLVAFRRILFGCLGFPGLLLIRCSIAHNKGLDGLHERLFCHDILLGVLGSSYPKQRRPACCQRAAANIKVMRPCSVRSHLSKLRLTRPSFASRLTNGPSAI